MLVLHHLLSPKVFTNDLKFNITHMFHTSGFKIKKELMDGMYKKLCINPFINPFNRVNNNTNNNTNNTNNNLFNKRLNEIYRSKFESSDENFNKFTLYIK